MNIATDAPTRPSLRYYGGKWNLANWIINHFPTHTSYVEPCGGAASVLLQKPRSFLETYNDLHGNVVNFFRVLRDRPDELIRKIRLTPWAREEYNYARTNQNTDCQVERARLFWVASAMSISSMGGNSGMRILKGNVDSLPNSPQSIFCIDVSHLEQTAERLRGVQIESADYREVIEQYDHAKTLFYFDPPYVTDTLTVKKQYAFEWSDTDHIESAKLLNNAAGFVVVSGYDCQLYKSIYEDCGWKKVQTETNANSGTSRIESLWLSPRTWSALQGDFSDTPLFSMAAD